MSKPIHIEQIHEIASEQGWSPAQAWSVMEAMAVVIAAARLNQIKVALWDSEDNSTSYVADVPQLMEKMRQHSIMKGVLDHPGMEDRLSKHLANLAAHIPASSVLLVGITDTGLTAFPVDTNDATDVDKSTVSLVAECYLHNLGKELSLKVAEHASAFYDIMAHFTPSARSSFVWLAVRGPCGNVRAYATTPSLLPQSMVEVATELGFSPDLYPAVLGSGVASVMETQAAGSGSTLVLDLQQNPAHVYCWANRLAAVYLGQGTVGAPQDNQRPCCGCEDGCGGAGCDAAGDCTCH